MQELELLDWIYGVLLMALGALWALIRETLKDMKASHEKLDEKVDTLRNEVSKDYMPRKEVAVLMGEIKGSLQRIEDKLDGKVDKK
jgi:hypothetical protein